MLGTSAASRMVQDISSLADIARAIGDASKADRLEAIRDEFKSSLDSLKAAEIAIADKIKEEKEVKDVNDLTLNSLQKWNDELDKKEAELKEYDAVLQQTQVSVLADQKQLQSDTAIFQQAKSSWMYNQNQIAKDFAAEKDRILSNLSDRETNVKSREIAVSTREAKVDSIQAVYEDKLNKLQSILSVGK